MAANSWDNNRGGAKKIDLSQHIFGGTIGGPIVRNKMFFFGDYQGFLRDRPGEQVVSVAPGGLAAGRLLGRRRDHPRSADRAAVPRQQNPCRAGSARSRGRCLPTSSSIRCRRCPAASNNLVARLFGHAEGVPGRRQGRLRTSRRNDRMFGRVSYQNFKSEPERAPLESQLIGTNDSPFLGLAFNWTRTVSASTLNELLVGYTQGQVRDESRPTGPESATPTRRIGIPGGQPIPGLSNFDICGRGIRRALASRSSTTSRPIRSRRSSRSSRAGIS